MQASDRGDQLLRLIAQLAGLEMCSLDALFINEFELLRLQDGDPSGWPDFAYFTDSQLLIIELKTEAGSHRRGQLSYYDALARHHHSDKERRLVYLTPPLRTTAVHDPVATTHVLLSDIRRPILQIWADAPTDERTMSEFIVSFIDELDSTTGKMTTPPPKPAASDLLTIAEKTAQDGKQRAADVEWDTPEAIESARVDVREALSEAGTAVQPWIWKQTTSGGKAMTGAGARVGVELRFSKRTPKP